MPNNLELLKFIQEYMPILFQKFEDITRISLERKLKQTRLGL
jgi:hypothetical protein